MSSLAFHTYQTSVTRRAMRDDAEQREMTQRNDLVPRNHIYVIIDMGKTLLDGGTWSGWLTWPYTARCREKKDKRIYTALDHFMKEVLLPVGGGGREALSPYLFHFYYTSVCGLMFCGH